MIIFSPGPANISKNTRRALLHKDICHRGQDFTNIFNHTRALLSLLFKVKGSHEPIIFTGSGTAAIEATIASLAGLSRRMLVVSNGIYGERAYDISRVYKIDVKKIEFPSNARLPLDKVEEAIKKEKIKILYVVHHETTTGLLNPLKEIARLAHKYNLFLIVDGVSSIAGEELQIKKWGIDVLIASANKCIRGISGLSFVFASHRFLKEIKNKNNNSYYLNLYNHLIKEKSGQTPFTPAVHSFYGFRQALIELEKEGVTNRIKHYKKIAFLLRQGLRKQGFKIYVDDDLASNTMTTVFLPEGVRFSWLYKECRKYGFEIYSALGELSEKAFRLGTVGCITVKDIQRFISSLNKIISNS